MAGPLRHSGDYHRDAMIAPPPAAYAGIEREFKELQERKMKEQHVKNELYRHLIDSWSMASPPQEITADARMLGDVIRAKIEEHKKMIATLEWFASHLSLDKPEESILVGRVILEGLNSMARNRG
jgi:hypothetical protein